VAAAEVADTEAAEDVKASTSTQLFRRTADMTGRMLKTLILDGPSHQNSRPPSLSLFEKTQQLLHARGRTLLSRN
jgi:hypothetical protein